MVILSYPHSDRRRSATPKAKYECESENLHVYGSLGTLIVLSYAQKFLIYDVPADDFELHPSSARVPFQPS